MTLSAFASGRIGHQHLEGSPDSEDRDHIQSPAAATSRQDVDMDLGKGWGQGIAVVARCGPLYYFLKERSNIFGHLGHLGHFEKCQACLHMTMEVTSNMEVILKVIFV